MFYKRNTGIWVKVIFYYIVFAFISDSTLLMLLKTNEEGANNAALYNVLSAFTLVEFTAFTFFLYRILESRIFQKIILFTAIAFYLFAIGLYIKEVGSNETSFDSLSASVEAILIVTYCIFYLFDQMNKPQVFFIYQEPNFWFVVAFILYFSGTLFLFIQASELDAEIRDNFWKINYFLNITKNILFAIAFSTRKSKTIQFNSENPFHSYP